ncbi:akirin-1-like isoform X2 [Peromyscus leucopus]|uniref:akirin-1-like isoform X2 n=1 Tax=Peromyscus leucopus TaxID=10041 RepID=UPI0010A14896|nr:akirin-1-like isoform X2 [Peromyscus leucopus]
MACRATLKQPIEFQELLLSPGSPKQQLCAPLPGPTPGLRPRMLQMQMPPASLQQPALEQSRLPTPEQIFQNIKQECSRYQRWRHLEVVLSQSEACTSESQPPSSALTAPISPEQYESFVKFTHDQIMRRYGTRPTSYVS